MALIAAIAGLSALHINGNWHRSAISADGCARMFGLGDLLDGVGHGGSFWPTLVPNGATRSRVGS